MSIEPTASEYDAIGEKLLARVRGRARRKQSLALAGAGLAGAAIAFGGMFAAGMKPVVPPALEASTERIVCYAAASPQSGAVAVEPAAGASPISETAIAACAEIWRSGVFDSPVVFELQSGGPPLSASSNSVPPLRVCELPDGSIAVFPQTVSGGDSACEDLSR